MLTADVGIRYEMGYALIPVAARFSYAPILMFVVSQKKFKARQRVTEQCGLMWNMSVEGFVLIGVIPPWGTDGVNWDLFPPSMKEEAQRRAGLIG